jgi:hypothetical protein
MILPTFQWECKGKPFNNTSKGKSQQFQPAWQENFRQIHPPPKKNPGTGPGLRI